MHVGKRASAKVYVDNSAPADGENAAPASAEPLKQSPKTETAARRRVTLRLSHDISTEQLLSDQLIDGKVADGEDDEDDEEETNKEAVPAELERPRHKARRSSHRKSSSNSGSRSKNTPLAVQPEEDQAPKMYRIESHSHLSSLDAKHLDKQQQLGSIEPKKGGNRVALAPLADANTTASTAMAVCSKCQANKDMPPLHCAAYSGHVACLGLLLDDPIIVNATDTTAADESVRPYYLDKKRRTPLFYSCAANRIECCALLLRRRAEWRDLADKQLDTPVHVCCFFGWHGCLQHLLDSGADPHGRNAKGFKPSHIAKTRECLELLLSYGDDLQQGDKLGRTPLFVACARDRSACVEFLCSWNHQTRSWMLEQEDQRGDRPIHAAACNGSDASLEILLRYGADPFIQNAKSMTPKDLATANNHQRCVELLAKAEQDLTAANAWFAPANAAGSSLSADTESNQTSSAPAMEDGWIECWDSASSQPFYYNNLSGKCQWEVPEGFQPRLLELMQSNGQQQQQQYEDDENGEYVWVKKKRQTVCVVTGKESEWTAVQDPTSKAIYYKNTRTGQSQWEEPDAVQQLQSASAAQASQQATKVWDELESSRTALTKALAADKQRQMQAQQAALEAYKLEIQCRRDDIRKKEEQAKLQQLLPRSSFIRRKKQSMMMKIKGSDGSATLAHEDEDKMELICQREPSLDIFLSTYLRLHGVRDLQLSIEKRFFNCLFHYYVALVDPVQGQGLSKSQFRTVLRDAGIIPSSFGTNNSSFGSLYPSGNPHPIPTLKLHVVDLIFAQATRTEALETSQTHGLHATGGSFIASSGSHSASHASLVHSPQHRQAIAIGTTGESQLGVVGFVAGMQIVRERMVALAEEQGENQQPLEIDDDEEWFLTTFVLPLTVRLGGKLLTQIRECKELDLEVSASSQVQALLSHNRLAFQRLHRYYTSLEPNKQLKMLTFRGLSQFALDFCLVPQQFSMPTLYQLYEAVNWISGHAHTQIIAFEKFQQLLTIIAIRTMAKGVTPASTESPCTEELREGRETYLAKTLVAYLRQLEVCPAIHRVAAATPVVTPPQDTESESNAVANASASFFSFP